MSKLFKLHSPFAPAGSQPKAIRQLVNARAGRSTLLGVTGSGKTFTIANVIAQQQKPVVILSPNKTLAAQLYEEFSLFFPENKVCYFVSYYDYYQPESYLPAQDIYIPKETKVNSELDRLRVEATASILNRRDVIIITSVSCIYSLGNPSDYHELALPISVGQKISRANLLHKLIFIQYQRNDVERTAGTFRVSGTTIEINLPYQKDRLRIEMFGDVVEGMSLVDKHTNNVICSLDHTIVFPAKHFVSTKEKQERALASIQAELQATLPTISNDIYRERLQTRVSHDLELLREIGYCPSIENYSRHFDGRTSGEKPYCLFDFFKKDDFLLVIDESHIALPQLRGMYAGDRSRKTALIEYGFRLPSAADNRPLTFQEVERYFTDVIFVSATPGDYELKTSAVVAEQVVRPTGLVDPVIEVHPRINQLDHLCAQIMQTKKNGFRTLITVLTKKMAEELARYLENHQITVCYLHCDIKTPARTDLLQKLRLGVFDCLVGVNLLREGLDLPEVALVAIMDADIESFLRDKRSLIQTIGRAARNTQSRVVLYADTVTRSMQAALDETDRRRALQIAHNQAHGITATSVSREVTKSIGNLQAAIAQASKNKKKEKPLKQRELSGRLAQLELEMHQAADNFEFEKAIKLRDEWLALKQQG